MCKPYKYIFAIPFIALMLLSQFAYCEPSTTKYVVLNPNVSFEKQVVSNNAIYEIKSCFTLTRDFKMPDNSTLLFKGGKLRGNITLTGNNTQIYAGEYDEIFEGVICKGKWFCEKASICWWGAKDSYKIAGNGHGYLADIACDTAISNCVQSSFNTVFFPVGCWYITKTIQLSSHKDIVLSGGPAIKSYYLSDLVHDNSVYAANIYTDQNIKVFSIRFNGEEVINIKGGSIDVSQVFLKGKKLYNETVVYFDISNGCKIMQAYVGTHMINYQDENTAFNSNSRGVLFHINGPYYSFATDVTVECKINGFVTGIETLRSKGANKGSWVTDLKLNSHIRKSRTAIKLPEGDGTVISGTLQSASFFDNKGGPKDKEKYPFIDVGCRFVQINATIWDVNSVDNGKWANGKAIRITEEKATYDISPSIISQYGPKKAIVLPK